MGGTYRYRLSFAVFQEEPMFNRLDRGFWNISQSCVCWFRQGAGGGRNELVRSFLWPCNVLYLRDRSAFIERLPGHLGHANNLEPAGQQKRPCCCFWLGNIFLSPEMRKRRPIVVFI